MATHTRSSADSTDNVTTITPAAANDTPRACRRARAELEARRKRLVARSSAGEPALNDELARIDEALEWIAAGLYGRCSVCCATLDAAQIERDPTDKTCHRCRRAASTARRRRHRPAPHGLPRETNATLDAACSVLSLRDGPDALNLHFLRTARLSRSDSEL